MKILCIKTFGDELLYSSNLDELSLEFANVVANEWH